MNLKCSIYSALQYFKTYDKPDLTKTYNINNHINVIKLFLNHSPSFDSVPLQIKIFVHFYQQSISKDNSPKKKIRSWNEFNQQRNVKISSYISFYMYIHIYIISTNWENSTCSKEKKTIANVFSSERGASFRSKRKKKEKREREKRKSRC